MPSQKVSVLSWNIDMDTPPVSTRTRSLIRLIREINPDVVLLQEVTDQSLPIIKTALCTVPSKAVAEAEESGKDSADVDKEAEQASAEPKQPVPSYCMHIDKSWEEELPYFPLALTRREGLFKQGNQTAIKKRFLASKMHRAYISISGETPAGLKMAFFTSHLESLSEGSTQRKDQLAQIFEMQRDLVDDGVVTVFAGDTNLREAEVPARDVYKTKAAEAARVAIVNGEPAPKRRRTVVKEKFVDAWLAGGAHPKEQYTWDMRANDNLKFGGDFTPYSRYDRAFLLTPKGVGMEVEKFRLVGKEKLSCGKFISDHWGVCFDIVYTF